MKKKINFNKVKKEKEAKAEKLKMKKRPVETESKPKKEKKPRKKFRIFYWLASFIVFCAIIVFVAGVGFCYYIVKSAPEFNVDKMFEKEATRIYDSKGNLIATLGTEQRQKITYNELPEVLIDAIIATEDSRFFQHNGFDAPRFLKASVSQVLGQGGGGASTLTMQLSKLAFTSTESEGLAGIIRKFTDIYMAVFKMEKTFTKEEIIEYYVNTPCMGGNIYGVQQASKYYFGKNAKDLNLVEAAQIAGMFQSPNGYNPYVNPNDANERKNTVLYLMKRHGYITDAEYKAGTSIEIKTLLDSGSTSSSNQYQGFIDTVVQEVIDDTGNNPYDVPMDIYTTMVKSKQDVINNFYKTFKFKDKKVEVGVGVIDNDTGAILAVGAGRYKTSAMTLNVATFWGQTKRQPGSTAKPLLDYAPAIEFANMSTYGPFIDDKTPYAGTYMRNFGGKFKGFRTAKDCLSNSVNSCALQAFRLTTNKEKYDFVTSLGLDLQDVEAKIPDSYSIGAFNGVSPVQLAGAYAAFGNGGYFTEPHSYTKLVYRENDEVYEQDLERKRVMKPQTAYMIASILKGATSYKVKVSGTDIATKTGTTSYDDATLKAFGLSSSVVPDSWTSSFSPDYAIAIWYGYADGMTTENAKKKYYLTSSHFTERTNIQAAIANKIYEKNARFKNPGGIVSVEIEHETIPPQLASANTPSDMKGKYLFIAGTEPNEVSSRYTTLNNPTAVTYTTAGSYVNLSWVSPGTPSAVDQAYLTDYFNNGYTIWAEDYLKKRLSYNKSKIGNFGYDIYLTQGTSSKHVGFTTDTTYSINLAEHGEGYDGVIIKSAYSIFKSNRSSGYKLVFESINEDVFSDSKVNVTMSGLNTVLTVNSTFKELNTTAISGITYDGTSILTEISDLSVTTGTITNEAGAGITPADVTKSKGIYKVNYQVNFTYNGNRITRTFTQTIIVQ